MNKSILVCLVMTALVASAMADLYLHAPRGSNNKLNEQNTNAQNQNRLFDSQNNARGGYQWGAPLTYYSGSLLQIEWTSQHGCGQDHNNVDCNYVLQYMCGPWIRDGTQQGTAETPGTDTAGAPGNIAYEAGASLLAGERGQQEPLSFYQACRIRSRNKGLFIADRGVNNQAIGTRQNNGGDRHGFECPEERDYYPHWNPSPWKDIAVLTSNPGRCGWYRSESQNVQDKGICLKAGTEKPDMNWGETLNIPKIWEGQAPEWDEASCGAAGNQWYVIKSWGLGKPDCYAPSESRDNHLGNVYLPGNLMTNSYKWIIPSVDNDDGQKFATCVFRMRYNISSEDYLGFQNIDSNKKMIDFSFNGKDSPIKNNPNIIYGSENGAPRNLTLNIDTSQFGRTFQDRSHSFKIAKRPGNVAPGARIFNLSIRGRRGNIVQAYPAVEFDFTPNWLSITRADYIHFQWTGTKVNPGGQAGNGLDSLDAHNLVPIKPKPGKRARGNYAADIDSVELFDYDLSYTLAHQNQPPYCVGASTTGCCKRVDQHNNNEQDPQNCNYLNMAEPYFDGGATRPKSTGTFYFMNTRNNDFTNRSNKMTIKVSELLSPVALTGIAIGSAGFLGAAVIGGGVWYAGAHPTSGAANVFGSLKI